MFIDEENLYDFSGLKFPTPITDIKIFEWNNLNGSINVYGLKQKKKNHIIYPLKVVDEENKDDFDLLLITDRDKSHYIYISNYSRFVRAQKTYYKEKVLFCKRCFTLFDNQPLKNTLYGQAALDQHNLICGVHKPILPQLQSPGTIHLFL
jgi:hypothetical protein